LRFSVVVKFMTLVNTNPIIKQGLLQGKIASVSKRRQTPVNNQQTAYHFFLFWKTTLPDRRAQG
jgi:hypothetical protein